MGTLLFLLFVGIPAGLAYLFHKAASKWPGTRSLVVLLLLALGGGTAWLGYQMGFVGFEDAESAGGIVMVTYPVLGIVDIAAGALIALSAFGAGRQE